MRHLIHKTLPYNSETLYSISVFFRLDIPG